MIKMSTTNLPLISVTRYCKRCGLWCFIWTRGESNNLFQLQIEIKNIFLVLLWNRVNRWRHWGFEKLSQSQKEETEWFGALCMDNIILLEDFTFIEYLKISEKYGVRLWNEKFVQKRKNFIWWFPTVCRQHGRCTDSKKLWRFEFF